MPGNAGFLAQPRQNRRPSVTVHSVVAVRGPRIKQVAGATLVVASTLLIASCVLVNDRAARDRHRVASVARSVLREVKPGLAADDASRRLRAMGVEHSELAFAADDDDHPCDGLPLGPGEQRPPFVLVAMVRQKHRGFLEVVTSEPQIWVFLNADRVVTDVRMSWVHTGP